MIVETSKGVSAKIIINQQRDFKITVLKLWWKASRTQLSFILRTLCISYTWISCIFKCKIIYLIELSVFIGWADETMADGTIWLLLQNICI